MPSRPEALDTAALMAALREAVAAECLPGAEVRAALGELRDPATMRQAGRILSRLPANGPAPAPRVRVLATCTVGSFEHLLRGALVGAGVRPRLELGEYGGFEIALGRTGTAGDEDPDVVVCLMDSSYFLPGDWGPADVDSLGERFQSRLADLRGLLTAALARSAATFVCHTVPLPAVVRDSVIGWRNRATLMRHWYRLNADILALAEEFRSVTVVDLLGALAETSVAHRDDRLHHYGDLPYTDGALLELARQLRRVVQANLGLSRKVLAVDLDNTLWGGIAAEVGGPHVALGGLYPGRSYAELQHAVRRLHEQGVLLALVSKNDPKVVEPIIAEHPDMVLRNEVFTARAINWAPKFTNIRAVAHTLNLSPDAFVFMDDSEFELGQVRQELPGVAIVPADGDPAYLARSLVEPGWFDVVDVTETDRQRPVLYRARALRQDYSHEFGSSEDYLRALAIRLTPEEVTPFGVARVAQLAARTNQFNLTGIRFDEARTSAMVDDPGHLVVSFSVTDRFGADGVVGAAWVERSGHEWLVLNLVLSCRVLGRGVELAMAGWLALTARDAGASAVVGRFVPSSRNSLTAGFWTAAGFRAMGDADVFALDLAEFTDPTPDWIALEERTSHA